MNAANNNTSNNYIKGGWRRCRSATLGTSKRGTLERHGAREKGLLRLAAVKLLLGWVGRWDPFSFLPCMYARGWFGGVPKGDFNGPSKFINGKSAVPVCAVPVRTLAKVPRYLCKPFSDAPQRRSLSRRWRRLPAMPFFETA